MMAAPSFYWNPEQNPPPDKIPPVVGKNTETVETTGL